MRRVVTHGDGPTLLASDLVESLFLAELLAPSPDVWLLSPWISDIEVIDNRAGAYTDVFPGRPARAIQLTDALIELAERGSHVHLVVRPDPPGNTAVIAKLKSAATQLRQIDIIPRENLHEKALLTSYFHLHGSMNFTHYGREINEEALVVDTDKDHIARTNLEYRDRYGQS
ncbi:phospholipase D-like domain-containing protein DpdK [Mycolicibacterium elephantis]|uniref:phospholipase D-like domain-containing protein DpdK n=1 Tax=Mycolicibacterium elephantis TaxID=81858 RepID=UPI003A8559B7